MSELPLFITTTEEENERLKARVAELEKEKYNSIEAWNSKLEKLTTENAELRCEWKDFETEMPEIGSTILVKRKYHSECFHPLTGELIEFYYSDFVFTGADDLVCFKDLVSWCRPSFLEQLQEQK